MPQLLSLNISTLPLTLILSFSLSISAIAQESQPQPESTPETTPETTPDTPPTGLNPLSASDQDIKTQSFTVDAMVGQVNGKPIYANQVFKIIGEEQLTRLGQDNDRAAFRKELAKLISANLQSYVIDTLIYAEAERNLSEQQQLGITGYLQTRREVLISEYGRGVLKLANDAMLKKLGHDLEQELEFERQKQMAIIYRNERILPNVNVTRKEVKRYYDDHKNEYEAQPTVTFRLIIVRDETTAKAVHAKLKAGTSFEDAAKEFSVYRAIEGGLRDPEKISTSLSDYKGFAWDEMNQAVHNLSVNEYAGPFKIDPGYGFVYVEKLSIPKKRPMKEIYNQIMVEIRNRKYRNEFLKYNKKLLETGNYTPRAIMEEALINVGMSRYAQNAGSKN